MEAYIKEASSREESSGELSGRYFLYNLQFPRQTPSWKASASTKVWPIPLKLCLPKCIAVHEAHGEACLGPNQKGPLAYDWRSEGSRDVGTPADALNCTEGPYSGRDLCRINLEYSVLATPPCMPTCTFTQVNAPRRVCFPLYFVDKMAMPLVNISVDC